MSSKYCLCYPGQTGVVFMGWGQTLATIYFLALFLEQEPYYMYSYLMATVAFAARAYGFFSMVYADESNDSVTAYYEMIKNTMPLIYLAFLIEAGVLYAEWSVFPTYATIFYGMIIGLSYHGSSVLLTWKSLTDSGSFWTPTLFAASSPSPSTDRISSKSTSNEEGGQMRVIML